MNDLPAHVVGFRASEHVTKADYDTILIPAVDKLAKEKGKINYVFVLETDIKNLDLGALYDDLKVGLKHLLQWHKMAIVTDKPGVNKFTDMAGYVIPGEVRSYTISELEAAKKWAAA